MAAAVCSKQNSECSEFFKSNRIATDSMLISHDTTDKPTVRKIVWEKDESDKRIFYDMKYEINRLHSFTNRWPIADITPKSLAEAGFFYLQQEDRVQCPFCHIIISNWTPGDKPLREHMRNEPKCPFLLGSDVGNVPLQNGKPKELCLPSESKDSSFIENQKKQSLNSVTASYKPKHPRMADIKRRLLTFSGWALNKPEPHQLAECGLYYSGIADVVTCFFCGGTLGNWEPDDNPWDEHSKFFPECAFLAVSKSKHLRPTRIQVPEKKPVNQAPLLSKHASNSLASDIVRQALDIFPESLVGTAMKNKGGIISSLQELCDDILELSEPSQKKIPESNPVRMDSASESGIISKDVLLCKLCMDRERGVAFQPCGHLVACWQCSNLISDCPVCRSPILCKIRTYLS